MPGGARRSLLGRVLGAGSYRHRQMGVTRRRGGCAAGQRVRRPLLAAQTRRLNARDGGKGSRTGGRLARYPKNDRQTKLTPAKTTPRRNPDVGETRSGLGPPRGGVGAGAALPAQDWDLEGRPGGPRAAARPSVSRRSVSSRLRSRTEQRTTARWQPGVWQRAMTRRGGRAHGHRGQKAGASPEGQGRASLQRSGHGAYGSGCLRKQR